jgi:hypothetical protein
VIVVRTIEDIGDCDVVAGAVRREVATVDVHGLGRGEIRRVRTRPVEGMPFRTFVAHVPKRRPPEHPLPRFTWNELDLRPLVLLCVRRAPQPARRQGRRRHRAGGHLQRLRVTRDGRASGLDGSSLDE